MADGLSLAASIIAVIDITAKVFSGSYGYISDVAKAPENQKKLVSELQSLIAVLTTLKVCAQDNPGSAALQQLNYPLQDCILEMKKLQEKLIHKGGGWWVRLKWPFGEKETSDFIARIERLKSAFNAAMSAEQLSRSKVIESDVQDIKADIQDIKLQEAALRIAKRRTNVLNWLYPQTFDTRHLEISGRRQENTGLWILKAPEVQGWITGTRNSQLLWGYGIPGAGKTFLSSLVIDHLLERAKKAHCGVAYIYFNFNEQAQQQPEMALASLVKQIACQTPDLPKEIGKLYDALAVKLKRPTFEELYNALLVVAKRFPQTFIVCDALDECDLKSQRNKLLPLFHRMGNDGMKLFLTSRDYPEDIQDSLHNSLKLRLWAKDEDIASYVERKIDGNHRAKRLVDGNCKQRIISELIDCAKGMFLLVHYHIEFLCQQPTVRKILIELEKLKYTPSEGHPLDPTYNRAMEILKSQPRGCIALAFRILSWLVKARRTLTVRELQLAVSIEQDSIIFDEENLPDRKTLLDTCASLVTIDEESDTVRLAHYTVQEYLVNNSIIPQNADLQLAVACVTFLSYDIFAQGARDFWHYKSRRDRYPLITYAFQHLEYHISLCDEASTVEFILRFLRNPGSISSYSQAKEWNFRYTGSLWSLPRPPTPLQIASSLKHTSAVQLLLEDKTIDIDVDRKDCNRQTVLQIMVGRGQTSIVELLLNRGADIRIKGSQGDTVIHNAVQRGQESMVQLLLDHGAEISTKDAQGNTVLHNAVERGQESMVQLLLDRGAEISTKDAQGNTVLHNAVERGQGSMVQLLLDRGANSSIKDFQGDTVLHNAVQRGQESMVQLLLDRGADISTKDAQGNTVLHNAVQRGRESMVHLLLDRGADIRIKGSQGDTVIHNAVQRGQESMVQLLLDRGTEISTKDAQGNTVLHNAVQRGRESMVHLLLDRGADISVEDAQRNTVLHNAVQREQESMVQLLLDRGANSSTKDAQGNTVLHSAVQREQESMVQLLLDRGADISVEDAQRNTVLHNAVQRGQESMVQLLLDRGANSSTKDAQGNTVLHNAVQRGRESTVHLLLDRGADIRIKDAQENTILHNAVIQWQKCMVKMSLNKDAGTSIIDYGGQEARHRTAYEEYELIFRLLLDKGADISATDKDGWTVLYLAAYGGHESIVQLLLDKGADISATDKDGWTVLYLAACGGHESIVQLLLDKGADISATDKHAQTVLHLVAYGGHESIVQLLLDKGADISATDKDGWTVLHLAAYGGHESIVQLLLDKGADISAADKNGWTALHRAAVVGHESVVQLLLDKGADISATDKNGYTALDRAKRLGRISVIQILDAELRSQTEQNIVAP